LLAVKKHWPRGRSLEPEIYKIIDVPQVPPTDDRAERKVSTKPLGKREIEKGDRRCIMVTKTLLQKKVLLFIAITLITWMPALPGAYGSILTSTPPTIDGNASEWTLENSTRIPVTNGFVHLMNDATNLYVLIDVTSDTGDDPPGQDSFWLTFDVNRNSSIDTGDVNFSPVYAGYLSFCYSHYTLSVPVLGECAIMPSSSGAEGFGTSVNDPITPHRIWELQIPRDYINATALNTPLRFALKLVSKNPSFDVDTPPGFVLDFSTSFLTDQLDREPGLIDANKWANLEFIRRAESGALRSAVRQYGPLTLGGGWNNNIIFQNSSSIREIQADVTLNSFKRDGDYWPRARLWGYFFNAHVPPPTHKNYPAGTYYEDVMAEVSIGENTVHTGLKAEYWILYCTDENCSSSEAVYYGELGSIDLGKTYTLDIQWDGTQFTFKCDSASASVTPVLDPYYSPPDPTPIGSSTPPINQLKGIGTLVNPTTSLTTGGYVDAKFQNVVVNGTTPIAISDANGMIDDTTWSGSTLEFVREQIIDGAYGMGLRSYGSFANDGLNLVNAQNFNEIQADLTVQQLRNIPNPNPATPMAALHGNFYSAGGANTGDQTDQTGDIKVLVGIRLGIPTGQYSGQPVGFYNIVKCTKHDCNKYNGANPSDPNNEFQRLYYYEDPKTIGPDLVGKPHRVSIRYDVAGNAFTFGFDGRLTTPGPSSPGWIVPPPLPTNQGPPNAAQKGPHTRIAFFSGPSGEGSVSAQFANIATVVDTDGDGVPDYQDNCPTVYNPIVAQWKDINGNMHTNSQRDYDLDGFGDACDLCPKVANNGGPCPATIGGGISYSTGPLLTVRIDYNGPATYLVPPDCNNVVFNSDPPIAQNCRRIPPYVLAVSEDAATPRYGWPGGDWIAAKAGDSWTIVCNLLEIFDENRLKAAGTVKITPTYTFFETDRGLDPAGVCASGDICVDTTKYNLFQGTIPTQQPVTVATTDLKEPLSVSIDMKPGSPLPKTINLGSQGNVPVAILSSPPNSTPNFDATAVNPTTVKLGVANVRVVGKKGTLQESISDVNGDGRPDMIVHFDTQAIGLTSDAVEVCLTGSTTDGTAFIGCNRVRIVP
jgi:hypothetical protein